MPATNALLQEGRYRINNESPHEGSGSIYEAFDTVSEANVLVKEIPVKLSRISTSSQREDQNAAFARQAKLLTEVQHASLLGVRDYFSEIGRHYLVMESVDGDDLQALLDRQKNCFPVSDVTAWADQMLDSVNYLHNFKTPIIHRNIRPANVILGSDGGIKLMLSEPGGDDSAAAVIAYSPLEQIWNNLDAASQKVIISKYDERSEKILKEGVDARSDIYSLGATLYHLLTARVPVDALERSIDMLDGNPDPLRPPCKIDPAIPTEISEVVMKAMEIKREYRFDSASIMRQVLKTAVVRVKEREAEEMLEEDEASNDIKLAEENKMAAMAEQLREAALMKERLQEAETQRLFAEQRAAEAEQRLRESEAERASQSAKHVAVDVVEDDLLGVLSPSLHGSNAPAPKISLVELVEEIPDGGTRPSEPSTSPTEASTSVKDEASFEDLTSHADGAEISEANVPGNESSVETLVRPSEPLEETSTFGQDSVDTHAEDVSPVVTISQPSSGQAESYGEINLLKAESGGSRIGIPAIAAGAAVIIMIAIGAWMFMSSGKPEPAKAIAAEVPATVQPTPELVLTDLPPANTPSTDPVLSEQAETPPADAAISDAPVRTAQVPKAKKPAPARTPAAKKAVTVDDLINDN